MEALPPALPSPPPAAQPSAPFEFSGGALCLDFVNTWGDRARPEGDKLTGFGALVAFSVQASLIDEPSRRTLAARATEEPDLAAQAFAEAVRLRESLYALFAGTARGRELPVHDLETLNTVLGEALAHLRLAAPATPGTPFAWQFAPAAAATAPLWPIARSAADLLVSPDLARVTQCDGSNCSWLFLDQSRTRNRRWCSMESCGNRAKARRHYHRSKG